jgi:hypothetical protein
MTQETSATGGQIRTVCATEFSLLLARGRGTGMATAVTEYRDFDFQGLTWTHRNTDRSYEWEPDFSKGST